MRSSGHRVLITGGSRGIGLALARRFHANGNSVLLVGRDEAALAAAVANMPGARYRVADLTHAQDREALVRECSDVSVLVNNAGVQVNGEFRQLPAERIDSELQLNLFAPLQLTHALLPTLAAAPEAAVINVTSVLALVPKPSAAVYCASKAALHSFTQALRWQLEGTPVRVFELMPPLVDTAMTTGRGSGKLAPEAVAAAFWQGYLRDQATIKVGKAKAASVLARVAPSVAERIMRKG
ncbi:MAG TPA: SDR family NAD(P)-dependent oxidoreductase [Rhizobacter sp.]|nr:SDR family NAD(P)-dependent oxidoreductase [Rhizobacter sp.]